jgi:hypothetical protein
MRLGEPFLAQAAEAVAVLEREAPGPALVAAQAQLANSQAIVGHYADAIITAERALVVAGSLGLPEPARALGYRGFARVYLGDASGVADMERALELLAGRGAAQDAAIVHNNLALVRYLLEGPARSLAGFEQGAAYCRERGLEQAALVCETNCPGLLAELGHPQKAIELVHVLFSRVEEMGDILNLVELRSVEFAVSSALGSRMARDETETLIRWTRTSRGADSGVLGFTAAAHALMTDAPDKARGLLRELTEIEGASQTTYYRRQLPSMVRTALATGDDALARHLADRMEIRYPIDEHARCTTRAELAEHEGKYAEAATLYAEAAERWLSFGNVPERAYALLGEGRCRTALREPIAEEPLTVARELFANLGYQPALTDTEAQLHQGQAAAT